MVVPTDVQVAFITGALFVDLGRRHIVSEHSASPERSRLAYCRFRNLSVIYAALFLTPVIAVFFSAWPAWETQYWCLQAEQLRGDGLLSLLAGLYLIGLVLAAYLGNWLAFRWLVSGKGHLIRPVYLAVGAVTTVIFLIKWPAPIRLGSAAQFQTDPNAMPYIWQDTQFFVMFLALLAYCAVPYVVVFFRVRR
ncbi:MAG: hypothetical protein OEV49_15030 [candidate division Zixibacteria bacterium]|nr:hypothetical protein [candidate division Zixibacteria bacterium]MDH3936475.1 hypothetical protein [candidate division Zixibacteria bacterium]MDH4032930.1 hypothetical protein [candidate division Zixibacteria bacterium]